ncbi:3-oxoacyl-[acyl-carrier-protein] synthase 2 [Clostridia bacterium]|nr:3-oxoacyl-[acyl-carrier-protein] synthase 2 [Clostridia bacterium]
MINRVAITGIGMVTAAGLNVADTWKKVLAGETAIKKIARIDTTNFKAKLAAEIPPEFNPDLYVESPKDTRRLDRFTQYSLAAVDEAVKLSGLDFVSGNLDKTRCGVIYGSGIGGIGTLEDEVNKLRDKGPSRVSPIFIPMLISNITCGHLSIKYGLEGTGFCPVTACSTGTHAIGEAARAIRHGYADIMIAGGADAAVTPVSIAGFQNMNALCESDDPATGLLPFDRRRAGFVMGEGAGAVILENYDNAVKRGAVILGEVAGYAANFDANHITQPDPSGKGAANAIKQAAADAGINLGDIGYINAHGTGTKINDKVETAAIKSVFGEAAYKIPVSSTKGVTGHMLGAAGAVEAIFALLALKEGILPPTANLYEPDPELDLDYIPLKAREQKAEYAVSTSLGFGSTNGVLILKKGQ